MGSRWGPRWTMSATDADRIVGTAIDHGINFMDTANIYNGGESEEWLGRALAAHRARDRVVISTKFGYRRSASDLNSGGAGRASMVSSVESSLRKLQTDHIDLLYLHLWDRVTPVEETLRAVADLCSAGKVRFFGLSNVPAWYVGQADATARLSGLPRPVALQLNYNLLERSVEAEFFSFVRHTGVSVVAWGPLANGVLADKYDIDVEHREVRGPGRVTENFTTGDIDLFRREVRPTLEALRAVATSTGLSPAIVALAWVLRARRGDKRRPGRVKRNTAPRQSRGTRCSAT